MVGTVCFICWLQWQNDNERRWWLHEHLTCRDEWVEDGRQTVCMCGCSPRARARRAAAQKPVICTETLSDWIDWSPTIFVPLP